MRVYGVEVVRDAGYAHGTMSNSPPDLPRDVKSPELPSGQGWTFFDGLMEGPRGDDEALRAGFESLQSTGFVRGDLELEGGRFSFLLDDDPRRGIIDDELRDRIVAGFNGVLSGAGPGETTSTLRATELFPTEVRETLFAVEGDTVRPVTRMRERTTEDLTRIPLPRSQSERGPNHRALSIAGAIILALLLIWQLGFIDRMFSPDASELKRDLGPFQDLLEIELSDDWGNYVVAIRRGERYPADREAVKALLAERVELKEAAGVNAVADGTRISVILRDDEDNPMIGQHVSLDGLFDEEELLVPLPGLRGAVTLSLSLYNAR